MKILTSLNQEIGDAYGFEMLLRVLKFWPQDTEIMVYYDGPRPLFDRKRISWKSLHDVRGFDEFVEYAKERQAKIAYSGPNAFLMKAWPFCCKGFAWGDYLPDDDVIWLDADVHTFAPVTAQDISKWRSGSRPYSYLGRDSYTETGFILFMGGNPDSFLLRRGVLEAYRALTVFGLIHWTDCHVFDYVRQQLAPNGRNLSPNGKGFDHVFNQSILGGFMDHLKGPRKRKGYSPETHTSAEERDHCATMS